MEKESIIEVLRQYQKKFNAVTEIYRLTEEMGQLLSNNDRVSVQLVLKMRQDEMIQSDRCDASLALLEDAMPAEDRQQVHMLADQHADPGTAETWEEKKLMEIAKNIRLTLQKTQELDRRISSRIAGQDSFYSNADHN